MRIVLTSSRCLPTVGRFMTCGTALLKPLGQSNGGWRLSLRVELRVGSLIAGAGVVRVSDLAVMARSVVRVSLSATVRIDAVCCPASASCTADRSLLLNGAV